MPEEPKEEDDWTAYATAGFGQTDYSLWDDVNVEETESADEEADFDEGDDLDDVIAAARTAARSFST